MATSLSPRPYFPGGLLSLKLDAKRTVRASVVETFEPFTLSCAAVVRLDDPSLEGRFVLKLFDRRFAKQMREDEGALSWCSDIEAQYRQFVDDGSAAKFFDFCDDKDREDEFWADEYCETWNSSQCEAHLQWLCRKIYKTEVKAYDQLRDLQGNDVPNLVARPIFKHSLDIGSNDIYLDCPGLLLEYIKGFPLTDLAENAEIVPQGYWQYLCEEAIRIVHKVGDRGICNNDVKTRSFIIRAGPDIPVPSVCMIDFGLCNFRCQAESDREFREWQADQDEEGAVGRVMAKRLRGGYVYGLSARRLRLLDEFKTVV